MNIQDVMISEVVTCKPESSAKSMALAMWDHDCGCVPVVDEDNRPVGIVTDRDIAIAAALQNRPLWEIRARDITNNRKVICCRGDDEIHAALDAMRRNSIRRLPVVDGGGRLTGILAMGDIFAVSGSGSKATLKIDDTLDLLQSVSAHHMTSKQAPASFH